MRKSIFISILLSLMMFSCKKENIDNTSNNLSSNKTEQTFIPKCFTVKDIKGCRNCMGLSTDYCISHYDYATTDVNAEVGSTDKIITAEDLLYVRTHQCHGLPLPAQIRKDLPVGALDIVPGWNSFINEACATTWDNLTAIRVNDSWVYWSQIPVWTADPNDIDQNRFTFFWEVTNPYNEVDEMASDTSLTILEVGSYLLPVSDYGNMGQVCEGAQPLKCIIIDELTGVRYENTLISQASFMCGGQGSCDFGYDVTQVQYANYTPGFLYVVEE